MNQGLAPPVLTQIDWALIAAYFLISLVLGLLFTRRASKSTGEFFTSGGAAPWWLAGISMVATTFAADTPLAVTGIVADQGIAGNWVWWSFIMSVMATVFLYAKLWRRVGVMTDVELSEVRYTGAPAAFLRGFRAVYLGLVLNGFILGWVTIGMKKVVTVYLERDAAAGGFVVAAVIDLTGWLLRFVLPGDPYTWGVGEAAWGVILLLYVVTGLYSLLSGLWGVLVTDFFQFMIAIGMAIVLAVVAVLSVGGVDGLHRGLQARFDVPGSQVLARDYTGVAPRFAPPPQYTAEQLSALGWERQPGWLASQLTSPAPPEGTTVAMPAASGVGSALLLTFLMWVGIQWWSAWYPGHEPGGGGYIAQRIFSAKNEKHSFFATLLFSVCHFALRPWPWILVGLTCLVAYQDSAAFAADREKGYAFMMFDHLGPGWLGLMLVSFLAAFMSTIATQINWGSSYVVNDFYRRFVAPRASERHLVLVSRIATVLLVLLGLVISTQFDSVKDAWVFVIGVGAGAGAVYMLRWFWWRINAWSEIAAMTASFIAYSACLVANDRVLGPHFHWVLNDAAKMFITVGVSTVVWIAATFLTRPVAEGCLREFYRRARPAGPGWKPIAALEPGVKPVGSLGVDIFNWICGCLLIFGMLFGSGKLILGVTGQGIALVALALVSGGLIVWNLSRRGFETFAA